MITFFDYCFYRISTSWYYRKIEPSTPYIWVCGQVTGCEVFNIMTLINVYHLINHSTYNFEIVFIPILIIVAMVNIFVLLTQKKYEFLIEHYKDEKHKKLKGWGVFLYVISSLFLFLFTEFKLNWIPATSFF